MSVSVRTLLNNALYLSISDRNYSPIEPSGSEINAALDRLQEVVDVYRDNQPFFANKEIDGYENLQNINAVYVNNLDYLLNNVVVNLIRCTQNEFSEVAKITNLSAIPQYFWHSNYDNRIYVYPLPSDITNTFVMGYTPLLSINMIDEPLDNDIPNFYRLFLEYEVAKGLCDIYSIPWSDQKEKSRSEYYHKLQTNCEWNISSPKKASLKSKTYGIPIIPYLNGEVPFA